MVCIVPQKEEVLSGKRSLSDFIDFHADAITKKFEQEAGQREAEKDLTATEFNALIEV